MTNIQPIVMAGGQGTRLWPLSRKSFPKQFANVLGKNTFFQKTILRLTNSEKVNFLPPIVFTHSDLRFIVVEQLESLGIKGSEVFIEPVSRNTAPTVLAASLRAAQKDPNTVLLIVPSDHLIRDTDGFHKAIKLGLDEVTTGKIVTFGITPTKPETEYGYLELVTPSKEHPVEVKRFVEKPDLEGAFEMFEQGNYLWNSGIIMARAKGVIEAFQLHFGDQLPLIKAAVENSKPDLSFIRLEPDAWAKCKNISIDYAIMEKLNNLVAVPISVGWSDIGGWNAIWDVMSKDENGVALSQNAHSIDCRNSLLRSENENQQIVGVGLENIIAIAMPDAVLVSHMEHAQNVRKVVAELTEKNIPQAKKSQIDHRPWGWFEALATGDRFQVKRISVRPGAALSLQNHHHRSEHWIVVEGTALVTLEDKRILLSEGQSIHIPLGAIHRMENPGKVNMVLIEIQTGRYLGEDDIVRHDDLYERR